MVGETRISGAFETSLESLRTACLDPQVLGKVADHAVVLGFFVLGHRTDDFPNQLPVGDGEAGYILG